MNGKRLLDTNIIVAFLTEDQQVQERLDAVPELLRRCPFGTATTECGHDRNVCAFLRPAGIDVETAQLYGSLKAEQRTKGRPLPENDLWIAACARQHNLVLVTRDRHFDQVAGLSTELW